MKDNSQGQKKGSQKRAVGLALAWGSALLLAGAGFPESEARSQGWPRLQLEERKHDFGEMKLGEARSHLFRFANTGTGELRIEGVTAPCGCTALLLSNPRIPPGGAGQVRVTFRALSVGERIVKWVTVRSTDPQEPLVKLKILASVPPRVAVRPGSLRWGRLRPGEPIPSKTVLLAGEGLEVKRIEASSAALRATLRELGERKGRRELELWIELDAARLSPGRINQQVTLYTNQEGQEVIVIPVLGRLEGEVGVEPPLVSFGRVQRGEAPIRSFEVSKAHPPGLSVLQIESAPDFLSARLVPLEPGRRYRIEVELKPEARPGRIQGEIVLHTDDGLQPTLRVPVYGLVEGE